MSLTAAVPAPSIGNGTAEGETVDGVTTFPAGTASGAPTITVTAPKAGWSEGTNTFTVASSNDAACVVLVKRADGSYERLTADKAYLESVYKDGAQKASYLAEKTLRKVYKKVGFVAR